MTAPDTIKQLVERFDQHRDAYRAGKYNETQLRNEFLNPFFEALGWDVLNKLGYSEENKHVIHEDSLDVEGAKKAPDYAFKIGRERKFFVEAKKPFVKIETNSEVAFQLKRYVWSAKLPLGILTDFEEFAIYECRSKPKVTDSVKTGRVMLLNYSEYIEKWDEIVFIFSYNAVMTGGFDKFAKSVAKKKGTAEVDSAFLAEIEGWREALAKNVALRNKLRVKSEADLNFAVQMTIDRIIFLRICEDRGYEAENQLQGIASPLRPAGTSPKYDGRASSDLGEGGRVYGELKKLFERADRRYNSGLFHFKDERGRGRADTFTTGLEIDDKVLKDIIKDLYYPAPYVFALIPADILGQIYEQFLGKVIRLTASGNAKVEEKPEVRKAGGVYYTPTFIVSTIVINTLGKLLAAREGLGIRNQGLGIGMTPKEAALLKVLDPACGSGTFLLGAYQYLLDWHLNWYLNNDFEKWSKGKNAVLVQSKDSWKLSVEKKKEILLNNIYGVDIDPQAVEVTKLSLLLKVIEDPGQLSYLDERILPDLGRNIQCGNSLIGPDYWDGQLLVDEEERARMNAFDWKAAFPEVFAQGAHSTGSGQGFDAVVGNPPYVLLQSLNQPEVFDYLSKHYRSATYKIDTYQVFLEKSLAITRQNGYVSFITPNTYLLNKFAIELRKLILSKSNINLLRIFYYGVFKNASVDTSIIVLRRSDAPIHSSPIQIVRSLNPQEDQILLQDAKIWVNHPDNFFTLPGGDGTEELKTKIQNRSILLGEFATAYFGIQTFDRTTYVKPTAINRNFKPVIDGGNISRYFLLSSAEFVDFNPDAIKSGGKQSVYEQERIGVRQIGKTPVASILPAGIYTLNTIYNIFFTAETNFDLKFVLGVILSKSLGWYWKQLFFDQKQTFPKIKKDGLLSIPIPKINFSDPAEKAQHDKLVSLVERMLALHKSLKSTHNPQEADRLAREVESTDRAIDNLVYQLYGLSEEEIGIVEGR